jgi:uncharacterized protein (DUF1800 family)
MLTTQAAIAANRFGLGARPDDAERIGADPIGWLEDQLEQARRAKPESVRPPASAGVLQEIRQLELTRALAQRARAAQSAPNAGTSPDRRSAPPASEPPPGGQPTPAGASPAAGQPPQPQIDAAAIRDFGQFIRDNYLGQVAERNARAVATDQPFVERLVHFWSNHFAVSADKQPIGAIAGLYEREAIRPHVTGSFLEMLMAVEQHPAMLLYLDQAVSMGPNSTAASFARNRGRELGLNENLAREILELHTLGVDGGYDQRDVTEFAKVLTGWSIGGQIGQGGGLGPRAARALAPGDGGNPGEFYFRPMMHEPDEKTILGRTYKERGIDEGEAVLKMLALHPSTARHLATKLARHFVADEPPAKLVDELAAAYLDADGELVPMYRALIRAEESWRAPLAKFKTPQDFVISTFRAVGAPADSSQRVTGFLEQLGQRPFTPGSPAGWPDTAAHWDSGNALLKRIEWAGAVGRTLGERLEPVWLGEAVLGATLGEHSTLSIARAESRSQALALMLASPEFQRR